MNSRLPSRANIEAFVCRLLTEYHIRLQPHQLFKIIRDEFPELRLPQVRAVVKAMMAEGLLVYTNELSSTFISINQKDILKITSEPENASSSFSHSAGPYGQPIHISDGLAFGSGAHPTTQLCLQGITIAMQHERARKPAHPISVLDIGTGSGILAIAAAFEGASKVVGIDTDPLACREARANAEKNSVVEKIGILVGDTTVVKGLRFNLVLANLRMPTLKGIFPALTSLLAKNGIGIFSGFRPQEGRTLTDHLPRPGWEKIWEASNRGWMAVAMERLPADQ